LLTRNENFLSGLKKIKQAHKKELSLIKNREQSSDLALLQVGSETLKKDIERFISNCPLYKRPGRHMLRALTVFMLTDVNIIPLLRAIEKNKEINTLLPPPWIKIDSGEQGTAIAISVSHYHNQGDVINLIKKNWPKIDRARKKFKSKSIKMDKFQPFTDFDRDIKILKDKETGLTYKQLESKYNLGLDTVKIIIKKIRKRTRLLFPSYN